VSASSLMTAISSETRLIPTGAEPRIIPAIYVKPFVKGQKNDYNDAEAIAEAALRNCWDNAPMESFFGTLKTELVHHREYPDRVARGATCLPISKAITIGGESTPPLATSPHSRQRQMPHNPGVHCSGGRSEFASVHRTDP
jgi:hypothetical protein